MSHRDYFPRFPAIYDDARKHWETAVPVRRARLAARVLSLPMHSYLDEAMQDRSVGALRRLTTRQRPPWNRKIAENRGFDGVHAKPPVSPQPATSATASGRFGLPAPPPRSQKPPHVN